MKVAAIALVAIAALRIAHADPAPAKEPPPDPAAERAANANLESVEHRRGIVFGGAVGASVTIGGGTGTGGDLALKIGHVATPKTVITFMFGGSAQLHKNLMKDLVANATTYALAGAQYWVGPSLWVSLGVGGGNYHCKECQNDAGQIVPLVKRAGVAGGVGAGLDLARWRGVVLGLEIYSVSLLDRDGLVMTSGMSLGLAFD